MTPEKAARQAANLLMLAYKATSPDDLGRPAPTLSFSVRLALSERRYMLTRDALDAIRKAARKLVPLIDFYPLTKVADHLATFVVEEKDAGTPLPQVHDRLKSSILGFLQQFTAQGEWEVVHVVRGIDLEGGRFTVGPCSVYLMDDEQFALWGRRNATGRYDPPGNARMLQDWCSQEAPLRGQSVAAVRVRAVDDAHARAKGKNRIEEVVNALRYAQLTLGFLDWPFAEIGLCNRGWQHDHSIVLRLDKPAFSTNWTGGGSAGNSYSMSRQAPGWDGLVRLVSLDLSQRSELQLRLTAALEWVGQAALAPSIPLRLVALVTALEALLIEESESLGKKTKLARRISTIVGQSPEEVGQTAKDAEELYEVRSECVHAGLVDVEAEEVANGVRLLGKTVEALGRPPFEQCASLADLVKVIEP
jgi:hypothetical protein